jgi:transcriptional regulator with XRE-family HTH domain
MNKAKIAELKKHGWSIGSVTDFLELSPAEEAFIELKVSLAQDIQKQRQEIDMTQLQLAQCINSSQSRVAKIEKNDPSVSLDLMVKALLALRTSAAEILTTIKSASIVPDGPSRSLKSHIHKQAITSSARKKKSLAVSR